MQASDRVELKMTVVRRPRTGRRCRACRSIPSRRSRDRSTSSTRRTCAEPGRASSSAPDGSRAARATRSSSCGRSSRPSCRRSSARSTAFNVEVDALPGRLRVLGVVQGPDDRAPTIREAVRGEMPLRKLFTKDQRAFYKEHAPAGLSSTTCRSLGPTFILKSAFQAPSRRSPRSSRSSGSTRTASRILELSTKCLPNEAFQVAAEARGYLGAHGIEVGAGTQQTKTKTALEFFSAHLREGPALAGSRHRPGRAGNRRRRRGPAVERDDADDDDLPTTSAQRRRGRRRGSALIRPVTREVPR